MKFHNNLPRWKMRSPGSCRMALRHILHYLIEHPEAKDTIQGILRWWLPGGIVAWAEEAVQGVLDVLVAREWLTQRQLTPSRRLYGMNKERLEETQEFLRELEHRTEGHSG